MPGSVTLANYYGAVSRPVTVAETSKSHWRLTVIMSRIATAAASPLPTPTETTPLLQNSLESEEISPFEVDSQETDSNATRIGSIDENLNWDGESLVFQLPATTFGSVLTDILLYLSACIILWTTISNFIFVNFVLLGHLGTHFWTVDFILGPMSCAIASVLFFFTLCLAPAFEEGERFRRILWEVLLSFECVTSCLGLVLFVVLSSDW